MLSETAVHSSTGLVDFLGDQNKVLFPKPGTLVSELHGSLQVAINKMMQDLYILNNENENNPDFEITLGSDFFLNITGNSAGYHENDENVHSRHDSFMDNYIPDLTNLIQGQVKFCREVVNRQLLTAKDEFLRNIELSENISAEDNFDFNYRILNPIFLSNFFAKELDKTRKSVSVHDSDFDVINETHFSDEENPLSVFLTKEDVEFDQCVAEFISEVTPEEAKNIIIEYSEKAGAVNCPDVHTKLTNVMVNFLFYRNAYENEAEPKRKTRYLLILEYYLQQVSSHLNAYKSLIKSKNLLLRKPSVINTQATFTSKIPIYVIEENWDEFTSAGGTVEMLLGALVARSSTDLTIQDLLDNKDSYISNWNASRAIFSATHINRVVSDAKIYLKTTINSILQDDVTKEHFESAKISVELKSSVCSKLIDQITYEDLKDLNTLFIKLVAGCMYSHTSAYEILSVMYELTENDENITPQQAAHVSAIFYLTDFLVQQIELTSAS